MSRSTSDRDPARARAIRLAIAREELRLIVGADGSFTIGCVAAARRDDRPHDLELPIFHVLQLGGDQGGRLLDREEARQLATRLVEWAGREYGARCVGEQVEGDLTVEGPWLIFVARTSDQMGGWHAASPGPAQRRDDDPAR